jgi:hypothetical protein
MPAPLAHFKEWGDSYSKEEGWACGGAIAPPHAHPSSLLILNILAKLCKTEYVYRLRETTKALVAIFILLA